ncbi:MAG: helix-hairpin-helix domain-containing protein [Sphingobacteriaceae bacterium]
MKAAIKSYFTFSKKEWNGMLFIFVLIVAVIISPYVFDYFHQDKPVDFKKLHAAFAKLKEAADESPAYRKKEFNIIDDEAEIGRSASKLFEFNPNHLAVAQWRKLGLKDYQIKVIRNYESKGGKFYKKEDLKKIYVIKDADYVRLAPYLRFEQNVSTERVSNFQVAEKSEKKAAPFVPVDLNKADSAQLTEIRGIGPAFASRIIKYRNRLGGFIKKEQLMEVFGLDSSKFIAIEKQVEVNTLGFLKRNINTVVFDDLKRFPYLNYKQVNAILQYKKQHGNYLSIADLGKVVILNEEILRKIEPYFQFDDQPEN